MKRTVCTEMRLITIGGMLEPAVANEKGLLMFFVQPTPLGRMTWLLVKSL